MGYLLDCQGCLVKYLDPFGGVSGWILDLTGGICGLTGGICELTGGIYGVSVVLSRLSSAVSRPIWWTIWVICLDT